jgi:S1-C subfamily serine protease
MKTPSFITIPTIPFIISLLVIFGLFGAMGYIGYFFYNKLHTTQQEQATLVMRQVENQQERNRQAEALIQAQAEALALAQQELVATQEKAQKTSTEITTLQKTLAEQKTKSGGDIVITSSDINSYLTGVVQVLCVDEKGSISSGSGTLWKFAEVPQAVLTNYHVIGTNSSCVVQMTDTSNNVTGIFSLGGPIYTYNQDTDTAILAIGKAVTTWSVPIANYNYSIAQTRKCPSTLPVGSPVVIVGFPAYAKRESTISVPTIGNVHAVYRSVTNGIVSGYDTSLTAPRGNLKYQNFFVSAKIDSGNSGGIALAKDNQGICTLGLPTWLTVGNYETQGLIQNIMNLLP